MAVSLHELPGLQPLALLMEKADSRLGFIGSQTEPSQPTLMRCAGMSPSIDELAAFDNDLVNLGRAYAVEHIGGTLHHVPLR